MYTNITYDQMDQFLRDKGFQPMPLYGVFERVYGKLVYLDAIGESVDKSDSSGTRLSMRVYTAIQGENSRGKGKDAMRVGLFWMYRDNPTPVGKMKKCLRVKNWKKNLNKAISEWDDNNWRVCGLCGNPMTLRKNKSSGENFWGCVTFFETGCKGRQKR